MNALRVLVFVAGWIALFLVTIALAPVHLQNGGAPVPPGRFTPAACARGECFLTK